MKIVFYSTNSNVFSAEKMNFVQFPNCFEQWKALKQKYDYDFVVVMQKGSFFLHDDSVPSVNEFVKFVFAAENATTSEFASLIENEKADIAIAVSYWAAPFDWMNLKDALVADVLRNRGIKTICHSAQTSEICFDKWKTQTFLENNGFCCPKTIYVHHEMFFSEKRYQVLKENVYKEYIFSQIEKMKFPLVIKDTLSLSSYGMDVVTTFAQAKSVLLSKKNNGDRIVQEFISGDSYGCELYCNDENIVVTPPLINSVNQFGLTSPKQNVKLGPSLKNFPELKSEMVRLAKLLHFNGIAQVDLIWANEKWYIIEINSRISGMSQTMAASLGVNLYELILFASGVCNIKQDYKYVMNLKFPLLQNDTMQKMQELPFVFCVNTIENKMAKQLREVGYTEVIFGQCDTLDEVMAQLEILKEMFPQEMEEIFYKNALKLQARLK